MRFLVLGDVLIALEGHSALLAVVLVGRHRRLLQARTLFVGGPHTRHARQAGLDCMPAGTRERAGQAKEALAKYDEALKDAHDALAKQKSRADSTA